MRGALGLVCAALLLAACGSSSTSTSVSSSASGSPTAWSGLRSVRVTVSQPGLPPPYGKPHTHVFTTPGPLARVTAALNAHHVARLTSPSTNSGCAGGYQIAIAIAGEHAAPVHLNAYRCANTTTGDIGGDLVGFLGSIGVTV
jgi:hypothetical protein